MGRSTIDKDDWLQKIRHCDSLDDAASDLIRDVIEHSKRPESHYRRTENRSRRRGSTKITARAKSLPRLYRQDSAKVFRMLTEDSRDLMCTINTKILEKHFTGEWSYKNFDTNNCPPQFLGVRTGGNNTLMADRITSAEVLHVLNKHSNNNGGTGPDRVSYSMLKNFDPNGVILSALFNKCLQLQRIPRHWKRSRTILRYKKGDPSVPSNWRPIALSNTICRVFTAVIANRLSDWASQYDLISTFQKGCRPGNGRDEPTFLLRTIIEDARRRKREVVIVWLDIANACGSVPHGLIYEVLTWMNAHPFIINLIRDIYTNATTTINTMAATSPIPIKSGIMQGDALSNILFTLVIEPLLQTLESYSSGMPLYDRVINVIAFVDDLSLVSQSPEYMEELLRTTSALSEWMGFKFHPEKSVSLHINKGFGVVPTSFVIHNSEIRMLQAGEEHEYLGVALGYQIRHNLDSEVDRVIEKIRKLDASLLRPSQKLEAYQRFIQPSLLNNLHTAHFPRRNLDRLDREVRQTVRRWLNLPQNADNLTLYAGGKYGGGTILRMSHVHDIMTVGYACRLLASGDDLVRDVAISNLRAVVGKICEDNNPTPKDICVYLNGLKEYPCHQRSSDITSLWVAVRKSTRRLKKIIPMNWFPLTEKEGIVQLYVGNYHLTPEKFKQAADKIRLSLKKYYSDVFRAKWKK